MAADNKNSELSLEMGKSRTAEDRQTENTQNAINSYAVLHLAIAKRCPDWNQWAAHEPEIRQALGYVYQALSVASAKGSLCVTLQETAKSASTEMQPIPLKTIQKAVALLVESGLMAEKNAAYDGNIPLVYDPDSKPALSRIYFQRYWHMEKRLAELLAAFAEAYQAGETSFGKLVELVPDKESERCKAIEKALSNRLTIISGGPGTGKTTAVSGVLECLLASDNAIRIALAAPTGKAAGRMLESIKGSIAKEAEKYQRLKQKEPALAAHTMHKWLTDPQPNGWRPSAEKPLDCDVLVVDEASMIDIELAVRFLSVVDAKRTRVILLGDPNQLAAVGPGSMLSDICHLDSPLQTRGFVAELTVSHRFPLESGFGQLAQNIKEGNPAIPKSGNSGIVSNLSSGKLKASVLSEQAKAWLNDRIEGYVSAIGTYLKQQDVKNLWDAAKRFQALAAVRHGKMSIDAINNHAEKHLWEVLEKRGLGGLDPLSGHILIVRKNSSVLDIYNGDVGIVLPQPESSSQSLQVYFGDRQKTLAVGRLPQYEPAFGITIHQSQGSEYEDIAVFLPPSGEQDNQLATKELLYTAVTRIKAGKDDKGRQTGRLTLFGEKAVYDIAVRQATERTSGLKARLREAFQRRITME